MSEFVLVIRVKATTSSETDMERAATAALLRGETTTEVTSISATLVRGQLDPEKMCPGCE